jgi:hypothetical protein
LRQVQGQSGLLPQLLGDGKALTRPSAGEKCCNSEAPTVARWLAE